MWGDWSTYSYNVLCKCSTIMSFVLSVKPHCLVIITRFKYLINIKSPALAENGVDLSITKIHLSTLCTNSKYSHQVDKNVV